MRRPVPALRETAERLDLALVARGLVPTRARARDAVLRGHVRVDGMRVDKPSLTVRPDAAIAWTARLPAMFRGAR